MTLNNKKGGKPQDEGNPVEKAIRHRVMPLGVHWLGLLLTLAVFTLVFNFGPKILAIALALLSYAVMRWLYKKEPRVLLAFNLWWKYGRHPWDAGRRETWR